MFKGKTLYFHRAFLHPGIEIGTVQLHALGNDLVTCDGLASYPGGSRKTPSHLMPVKLKINICLIGSCLSSDFTLLGEELGPTGGV